MPEFHKNGALHFHAFIKDCDAKLIDTKKITQNGYKVYKFLNFTMGINDVIDIREQSQSQHGAIANYMQKYITKDMPKFHNRKRYFASQALTRPKTYVNGVEKLMLQNVVKHHKPVYVDDTMELQIHPLWVFDDKDKMQTSFALFDKVKTIKLNKHRKYNYSDNSAYSGLVVNNLSP